MKKLLSILCLLLVNSVWPADLEVLTGYEEIMKKAPDIDRLHVRVWTIKKTDSIRVNLVEFYSGNRLHNHPDADHSVMVLRGKAGFRIGDDEVILGEGGFISVPKGVPHKTWPIGESVLLLSMDAPYYDPANTVYLED